MSTRTIIGLALIVPAAVVIFFILSASGTSERRASACTGAAPQCLPSLSFMDTNHEVYPAEDLKGKVVVVNFWATWCGPCNREIPALNRVYTKYKDKGVIFFGVDQEDIGAPDLLNFASDHEMTYPIVPMDENIARAFGMAANIPTTFIYDRTGTRRMDHLGPLDEQKLSGVLDQLLAE